MTPRVAKDQLVPRLDSSRQADDGSSRWGGVELSEASRFILFLVARFEGRDPGEILAGMIAERGRAIGLSPLLTRDFGDAGGPEPP